MSISEAEMNQLLQDVGGIKATLEGVSKDMTEGFTDIKVRQDKTNGRVGAVEKFCWALGGGLVILGALLSAKMLQLQNLIPHP